MILTRQTAAFSRRPSSLRLDRGGSAFWCKVQTIIRSISSIRSRSIHRSQGTSYYLRISHWRRALCLNRPMRRVIHRVEKNKIMQRIMTKERQKYFFLTLQTMSFWGRSPRMVNNLTQMPRRLRLTMLRALLIIRCPFKPLLLNV